MKFIIEPGGTMSGTLRVPGDKSMSHRAIMLGALATGTTRATGFLSGDDALATVAAFRDLGVSITGPDDGVVSIEGVGLHGLSAPANNLDMGNSGTSIRLLSGILAGQPFSSVLSGDVSLQQRPMGRIITPLSLMGAMITAADSGRPPLEIAGGQKLRGIHYDLPMASAQVKSCVLLAGLFAEGRTSVTEPAPTRDHTERMLRGFGYSVHTENGVISLEGGGSLRATRLDIPADISSAAFFIVGAVITAGADITLEHVGMNPTRVGVINILRLMGADIEVFNEQEVGGEPVADLRVRHSALRGIEIPVEEVPLAIDEFPVLLIAAACAEGVTTLSGAEELRVKESDRIASMAEGLTILGIRNEVREDGIVVHGGELGGGSVRTFHDHRIAMSFAIAGLRAKEPIEILDCDHVATSFPNFAALAQEAGLGLRIES
ncbi:3-phosphoshikimate 1-carboxyvinyltransferase [Luminiphilus syltensis NOR5-1B]|uniref:3-phosphoshikimate 1-carboxyvinyltransferase n=1 Tax=Luminiphilus syltensis NOR5-1B TaxID=565045 RepID=B8KX28_9GAMM|nr:3-phosphoshikimate 1-carboxyvinyltransferase [Luminiphilus syltensis]EED35239.1 3-phosphoshikimate 1-carboxyvinyltransferase [Luminiphilus syltensis NOR5-1B]